MTGETLMAIPYAPEEIARTVTRQLKAVAAELQRDEELHLPDFLDVDPQADYSQWVKQLAEKRRKAKNAAEGTANEQEKLCQILAKEFAKEKGWRALLNRLGRMQVEMHIVILARRKPSSDAVLNAFLTHIHTLEFAVGAPDSKEIVEDLFRKKDLVVHEEPKKIVKRKETTRSIPDPEPPEVEQDFSSPEPEPEPAKVEEDSGGSFWSKLGGVLLETLGDHLDRKVNEIQQNFEHERTLASQTPSIAGQWRSPAGGIFTIVQTGSVLSVEGMAGGVPLSASGQIRGKSVQISGFSPVNGPFQANLVVSPDGNMISGQLFDSFGRGSPVQLRR
jgi:hypothetical protein